MSGGLAAMTAPQLGGHAVRAALDRSGVSADEVDMVLLGNVVQAGVGPNPARQAAVAGGLPLSVPATTINSLCLSGLTTLAMAELYIRCGVADVVVVGGMESMTGAPHLLSGVRRGIAFGSGELTDSLERDALVCAFDQMAMGAATDRYQRSANIHREEQDRWAARSHELAAAARRSGALAEEIAPILVTDRRGDHLVEFDEGVRPQTTADSLAGLPPAFGPDGTITAGSASQLSDGACALVVCSRQRAVDSGRGWIAEIIGSAMTSGPDTSLLSQPGKAATAALKSAGLAAADIDLFEVNEAFAGVALQAIRELQVDPERVNVNGGAIALGHPVGMSGARLALSLALELGRRGGGTGVASICGGGGQGQAAVLRVGAAV
jgi:acetyl-CoA C-acetyltransferase